MAKITAPVEGFSGKVVGVQFTDGHAETDVEGALGYFLRHGYTVEGLEPPKQEAEFPEGLPSESWKNDQLLAYAKANGIEVNSSMKKVELLEAVAPKEAPKEEKAPAPAKEAKAPKEEKAPEDPAATGDPKGAEDILS